MRTRLPSRLRLLSIPEGLRSSLILAAITLLAYAPFIGQLGYYQEDLFNIWSAVTRGPGSFIPVFAGERPLIGYQFALLYPLLGPSPLPWHLAALAARLLTALACLWLLRLVWPQRRIETFAASLLFVLYPGFLQQPQAHTFLVAFEALLLALLSLGLSVLSTRTKSLLQVTGLNLLALIMAAVYISLVEYMIGLEVLRLILVGYALAQQGSASFRQILRPLLLRLAPFFLFAVGFVFWRLFVYQSIRSASSAARLFADYAQGLGHMLVRLGVETSFSTLEATVLAWAVPFYRLWNYATYRQMALLAILVVVALALIALHYRASRSSPAPASPASNKDLRAWLWIGLLAVILGLLPSIAADRLVRFEYRFDRYTLPATFGVALLVVGFLFSCVHERLRPWILATLVAGAMVVHVNNALVFRDHWQFQNELWQQATWRAPDLEDGTMIVAALPSGFTFQRGYEIWSAANLIYRPSAPFPPLTGEVLTSENVFKFARGDQKEVVESDLLVPFDYSKVLLASLPFPGSCVHFIDRKEYEISEQEDALVRLAAPYSRTDQIRTTGDTPALPQAIFGAPLPRTWCYYYQKASLARQIGDWQEIARLGDEARSIGYDPLVPAEWLPFLEGYATLGRDADAQSLAKAIRSAPGPRNLICRQLESNPDYPGGYDYQKVRQLLCLS